MKTTVTALGHEDLVNLLSTAGYSNNMIDFECHPNFRHLYTDKNGNCFEDKLATVLMEGGQILVYDMESEDGTEVYGKEGLNWVATSFNEEDEKVVYAISLETILSGINASQQAIRLANELFIDKEGDMWTAYNLMQIIVFGEEIYG